MKVLLISATLLALVLLTAAGGGRMRMRCPAVPRPENGFARGKTRIGDTKEFFCRRGYWPQGIRSITCESVQGQLRWSSDLRPFCVLISKFSILRVCVCVCVCVCVQ